jgi:hypothetical protein
MAEIEESTVETVEEKETPPDCIFPETSVVKIGPLEFKIKELELEGIFELFALGAHTLIGDYQNPVVLIRGILGNPQLKRRLLELSVATVPALKPKFEIQLIQAIWERNKDFFTVQLPALLKELNFGGSPTQ